MSEVYQLNKVLKENLRLQAELFPGRDYVEVTPDEFNRLVHEHYELHPYDRFIPEFLFFEGKRLRVVHNKKLELVRMDKDEKIRSLERTIHNQEKMINNGREKLASLRNEVLALRARIDLYVKELAMIQAELNHLNNHYHNRGDY